MKIKLSFLLLASALLASGIMVPLRADPAASKAVPSSPVSSGGYEKAVKLYQAGDTAGAVKALEAYLAQNPSDEKAKNLMSEIYIASSVESYLFGKEEESFDSLSKALVLTPDMESANRLYDKVKKSRYPGQQSSGASLPQDALQFQKAVEKLVQTQNAMVEQNRDSMQQIIKQSDAQQQDVLQALEKREDLMVKEIGHTRRASVWMLAGAIIGVLLIVMGILYVMQKIAQRREQLIIEQGEKMIQFVQEQTHQNLEYIKESMGQISFNSQAANLMGGNETAPLALEDNTASKLRKIDIIDAEIVKDGKASGPKDEQILKTLLEDPDPAVRARTIQVLFKTRPDEAYFRVEEMLSSPMPSIRVTAVKLLAGMATEKSVKLLTEVLKGHDVGIRREAIASLKSLLSESLMETVKEEINRTLAVVSEKEGWIIK